MDSVEYYTLLIELLDSESGSDKFSFTDVEVTGKNTRKVQEIWMYGFRIETAAGSYELISPFRIKRIRLTKQEKKFGI